MSKPSMTLYQTEWCPYCRNVQSVLKDLGVPYITVEVPWQKSKRKDLFRISGQRGVPTLVDGDVIISDDDEAIIAYLKGRYVTVSVSSGKDVREQAVE